MPLRMEQLASATQEQQASQWLVMATQILALSSTDLASLIQQEAIENPALEVEEHAHCLTCGRALQDGYCPECRYHGLNAAAPSESQSASDEVDLWIEPTSGSSSAPAFDPPLFTQAPVSLHDVLTRTLQADLPAEDAPIIEYLVGSLDEHGYLRGSLAEATLALGVSMEQVERVLEQLQTLDPPGIGARSVRECLLLQLHALEARGQCQPTALAIVEHFLNDLSRGNYMQIAHQLGLSRREVEEAHAFIQQRLTPFPAMGYLEGRTSRDAEELRPIAPDVIIRRRPDGETPRYEVEVVEQQRFSIRVAPAYDTAYRQLRQQQSGATEDSTQIYQAMTRARFFLSSLRQRWQTMERIAWGLIERQEAFLEQGAGAMTPLTRAELAAALGVHPSTVSRATLDKYVLLPNNEVVPFATFFTASLPIKAALQEILDQANQPLSDRRLTELLAAQGIQVARRTVTKYRSELGQHAAFRRPPQTTARAS